MPYRVYYLLHPLAPYTHHSSMYLKTECIAFQAPAGHLFMGFNLAV